MACEKCEIWQHVDCLPNSHDKAELLKRKDVPEGTYPEYEFICTRCKKKAKEASKMEGGKTKEQLRKERERELNKAKYARRKEREKARKEEERRKRDEEQRLGLQNGELASSPMGEVHVLGVSSSPLPPSSSPDRAPMTTGQLYALPTHPPPNQHSTFGMSYSPQQVAHFNLNSNQSHASQYQQQQDPQGSISTPNTTFLPSTQQTPAQQESDRPPMSQLQPPRQSPQYPPVRPAIQPYWSPYTTSPTLPNGQTFPDSRPHSAPYTNGFVSSTPQARIIASKPPANTQYGAHSGGYPAQPPQQQPPQYPPPRPSPATSSQLPHTKSPELQRPALPPTQNNSYSKQQQGQRISQAPAIQPRPSKSPEIQRTSIPNSQITQPTMYPSRPGQAYPQYPSNLPAIQPRPSKSPEHQRSSPPHTMHPSESGQTYQKPLPAMPSPPSQRIASPVHPRNVAVPQNPQSQSKLLSPTAPAPAAKTDGLTQQQNAQQIPVAQNPKSLPSPSPQNRTENQNGLAAPIPEKQSLAGTTNVEAQTAPGMVDGTDAGNGSRGLEDNRGKDANTLPKESERTKMSFLLN